MCCGGDRPKPGYRDRMRASRPLLFATLLMVGCATTDKGSQDIFAVLGKANAAYAREDWLEAETLYRQLAQRVPDDAYAFFRLGNVYGRQSRWDEAVDAYYEALRRDAGMAKAYHNLAVIHMLQAEAAFEAAVAKAPRDEAVIKQARRMLAEIRKITRIPVQNVKPPTGTKPPAASLPVPGSKQSGTKSPGNIKDEVFEN